MHANAFGVSFDEDKFQQFLNYANEKLDYENCSYSEYEVDFIFEQDELTPETILSIGSLSKYWGKGIEEAYIAIKNVKITNGSKTLMSADRNPTLKIIVNSIPCIKFRCKQDEFNTLAPNEYTSTIVDLVGKCNLNEWMGNITPQILIEEYEFKQNIMDF
jgi:single-stranded DNA-specific DHH superfamily exonuclease